MRIERSDHHLYFFYLRADTLIIGLFSVTFRKLRLVLSPLYLRGGKGHGLEAAEMGRVQVTGIDQVLQDIDAKGAKFDCNGGPIR